MPPGSRGAVVGDPCPRSAGERGLDPHTPPLVWAALPTVLLGPRTALTAASHTACLLGRTHRSCRPPEREEGRECREGAPSSRRRREGAGPHMPGLSPIGERGRERERVAHGVRRGRGARCVAKGARHAVCEEGEGHGVRLREREERMSESE
jgi:hypothetical protein